MLNFITANLWSYLILIGLLSLAVGSFLNVVIHRLPIMVEQDWARQCEEFAEEQSIKKSRFNLAFPVSHCPNCLVELDIWQNIPIISYLFLRGRCAHCHTPIPFRYLIVEALSLILCLIAAIQFGLSLELIAVLILIWFLIAISFIDIAHQIIPDILTIPLIWIGLLASCFNLFTNSHDAILGAILGYLFFWVTGYLFKLITKKEGLGQGDFKLLAAGGAWLGWQLLPFMVLTSSILALIIGGGFLLFKRESRETPIPFGPFIALALCLGIIWGFDLTQSYLHLFGITWSNV